MGTTSNALGLDLGSRVLGFFGRAFGRHDNYKGILLLVVPTPADFKAAVTQDKS